MRLKAGREGGDRGWDGWMASLTQWTWVWASFGRWWRTGKPDVLQSLGSQRVWHNLATEQQQQWYRDQILPWDLGIILQPEKPKTSRSAVVGRYLLWVRGQASSFTSNTPEASSSSCPVVNWRRLCGCTESDTTEQLDKNMMQQSHYWAHTLRKL